MLLVAAVPCRGQSSAYATVSGVVQGSGGQPVGQAFVTLQATGRGQGQETTTSASGAFTFTLVRPGTYEIRVEALGYRPLVARTLSVGGGEKRSVDLTIARAAPPVLSVDTVALMATSTSRWQAGAARFDGSVIRRLPHRLRDVASVVELSTAFDGSLGAQGLPGDESVIVADGVPFYRAPHPSLRSDISPAPLFSSGLVESVTPRTSPADLAWPGVAGGYIEIGTRSSTEGLEVDGAYSSDLGWFSNELEIEAPSLQSYEATLVGTRSLGGDGAQIVLGADVLEHQTPVAPRVSEAAAGNLDGLDPQLLSDLSGSTVETFRRLGGLARLDTNAGTNGRAFVRGIGSYTRRAFEGAGPIGWSRAPHLAEESVDASLAGGYITDVSDRTTVELRGGFSASFRDFKGPYAGRPPAWIVDSGSTLGSAPYAPGESSRTDFFIEPVVRRGSGASSLRGGLSVRVSDHSMERGAPGLSEHVYSDPAALLAGRGYLGRTLAPEASFGTREIGLFAEYEASVEDALHLRLGARYDAERVGSETPTTNTDWQTATGLSNDEYPTSFNQFGMGAALTWDLSRSGRTVMTVAGSLREGDVDSRALFEVLSHATEATSLDYLGAGVGWPGDTAPAGAETLPMISLLGPDLRPPRTTSISLGLRQAMTPSVVVFVEGSFRRTDFLLRRRNLNLALTPRFRDPFGRDVYGTLTQESALVAALDDDARRFADFGPVWALDPDGWSEYRGATVGFEHESERVRLFGSYTLSESTDNRIGAAQGAIDASLPPNLPETNVGDIPWGEGTSDFDVPHRAAMGVTFRTGRAEISGLYRYRSGHPFTPGYRVGVDANGDGSDRNDVAYVGPVADLTALLDEWPCLEAQAGGFAHRNSCRTPGVHGLDARVRVRLGEIGNRTATLTLDGLDLIEPSGGLVDDALVLVDPDGTVTTSGGTVTVPVVVNQNFGAVLYPWSRGRMLRIGVRVGG